MPVYEYRCTECGGEFEYQQRMSDPPKDECERCQGRLERLISRSFFSLKGDGWYKDLYSSPKPKDASAGGESASSGEGSGSSGESSSGGKGSSDSGKSDSGTSKSSDSGKSASKASGS